MKKKRPEDGINLITTDQATLLTPALAEYLLGRNKNVRPIRQRRVRNLAIQITGDEWELNGHTLKLNSDRDMIDGQHRCSAVILADKSVWTYIVEVNTADKDEKSGTTRKLDRGMVRSMPQLLTEEGFKSTTIVSAVSKQLHLWFDVEPGETAPGVSFVNRSTEAEYPSCDTIIRIAHENDGFIRSIEGARGVRDLLTPSLSTFVHVLTAKYMGGDYTLPDLFFDKLTGRKPEVDGDPTIVLRRRMLQHKTARESLSRLDRLNMVLRAYSSFVQGKPMTKIVARPTMDDVWLPKHIVVPPGPDGVASKFFNL